MNAGNLLFGQRTRQNHSLEHATVTLLTRHLPGLVVSARANAKGFIIFADLDPTAVLAASEEALERLRRGECGLAIHPNCGTNLAVGTSLMMLGSLFAFTAVRRRTRIAATLASSIASVAAARPLGKLMQRYVTTSLELSDLRISSVRQRRLLGRRVVEVLTASISAV